MPPPKEYPVRIATCEEAELWAVGWNEEHGGYMVNLRSSPNHPWSYPKPAEIGIFMKWEDPTYWDFDPQYM
jgi:hypothetical protein